MPVIRLRHRPGTTLIELLIFLALLGLVVGLTLPMLFSAEENQLLQETVSIVEQNGAQILENVAYDVRQSERIVSPSATHSGAVLALQSGSGSRNPTIIGLLSGSLVVIHHSIKEVLSSTQVAVQDFVVQNTSTSTTHPSVKISFTVSRTIRLQSPHSYVQRFETTVALSPTDVPVGARCVCNVPTCSNNIYTWNVCDNNQCYEAATQLDCP